MSATGPRSPISPTPVLLPLTITDRLMLNTYLSNGQNATQTYRAHHPTAKYSTAESNGHKWLRKAKIQAELQRRLQHEHGITKRSIEDDLLWCAEQAKAAGDYQVLASIRMDCAKLAGFLVEKREVKEVKEEEGSAIRSLVDQALTPTGSGRAPSSHVS